MYNMCNHQNFEYIYNKTYKDECAECQESNIVDSIYCQCENSNNNTIYISRLSTRLSRPFIFEHCNVLKLQELHYSQRLFS